MKHDDVIGEEVPEEEALVARQSVMKLVGAPGRACLIVLFCATSLLICLLQSLAASVHVAQDLLRVYHHLEKCFQEGFYCMCAQVLGLQEDPPPERVHFPGSQPVSLDRANLGLLERRRFWVTWKADGTRYMLLLCRWGAYLLDRSFAVRRVQVRAGFPLESKKLQL